MAGRVVTALRDRALELGPRPEENARWRHWRLATDGEGVAWLLLDRQETRANTLSDQVLVELNSILEDFEIHAPKGLVIRSAKPSGFAFGADVNDLRTMVDPPEIEARLAEANGVFDRLAALPFATVAVIHGQCLGGGLELVLCCDWRIAVGNARLGFPEVLLGLHPGLGGTVRATRLVDPIQAMTMMLTGKSVDARKARRLGLVDVVTEERHVSAAVGDAVAGKLKRRRKGLLPRVAALRPGRRLAARRMRAETAKKARREHYPAPYALIDLWERHGGDEKAMRSAEMASFGKLLQSDTSRNLVRAFFLREGLKKNAGEPREVGHVHVVGAGTMGGEIAAWCAWQGLLVSLSDVDPAPIGKAIARARALYDRIGKDRAKTRDALDRLIPDTGGHGVRRADVVIEAAPEKLDLKQQIYESLEARMKLDAILATNTSSIPLESLAGGLKRPQRFVGLHFFNPVSRMQLVEVVAHGKAADDALAAARAFVGRIDRLAAPVKSAPGFLVNRALMPYLVEALVLLDEGEKPETVDAAAERFGMAMGPLELADQVGLDVCLEVADVLREGLDQPIPPAPDWLRRKVTDRELGRKTGKGLYSWKDGKPAKSRRAPQPGRDMADRLILPMLNACVACLREGVVADADTLDAAMIFGSGFAPFRGGPMQYARARGVDDIRQALARLAERHGERFATDPGWDELS